ncbi:MAG: P1 family peptidase [Bacillota bacterium]
MKNQRRIRDYGINTGYMKCGQLNSITDVRGVKVGHCTIDTEKNKTGITVILPAEENIFTDKMMAACHIINGFGKTTGTIQIEELGALETPIALTNTLNVGLVYDAVVEYMLEQNEDIGLSTGTVNPVVCECNDGYLNSIRERCINKQHVFDAICSAAEEFEEGSIGAGKGMSSFGMKGGIGTASRLIELDEKSYTLGALVLSNFGRKEDFTINGYPAGKKIIELEKDEQICEKEKGSIIIIIATDIPCSERQLKRIAKRAFVGMSKVGGNAGSGSGDIVISFSTANRVKHYRQKDIETFKVIHEDRIDLVFRAAAEAVEEAILNSLICSDTTIGRNGNCRQSLKEYIESFNIGY